MQKNSSILTATLTLRMLSRKKIAIIGGGPAALMLAASLDKRLFSVSIYERNAAPGRKFLVAGQGGFNLTHSEAAEDMTRRYTPASFMAPFLREFNNDDLRLWLKERGIETYVGTSRRVFPLKGIKPVKVLNVFEEELQKNDVQLFMKHEWKGWNEKGDLLLEHENKMTEVQADIIVFALGGGSWKVTGSRGDWPGLFRQKGIEVNPLLPSNCAIKIDWKNELLKEAEGSALKNCLFSCGNSDRLGEAVVTAFGLEGSGVYALSPQLRQEISEKGKATLHIDLKPQLSKEAILDLLSQSKRKNIKEKLIKELKLSEMQAALVKAHCTKEEYLNVETLASKIKQLSVTVTGFAPMDEAISTAGGIALHELSDDLELKKLPGTFCMGEMLDWDAPTGGYLLQACFSMGKFLAARLNVLHAKTN